MHVTNKRESINIFTPFASIQRKSFIFRIIKHGHEHVCELKRYGQHWQQSLHNFPFDLLISICFVLHPIKINLIQVFLSNRHIPYRLRDTEKQTSHCLYICMDFVNAGLKPHNHFKSSNQQQMLCYTMTTMTTYVSSFQASGRPLN